MQAIRDAILAGAGGDRIARRALGGYVMSAVGGATHFHFARLGQSWGPQLVRIAQVGHHIFFGRRGAAPIATIS